jgi:hypothetical protein
MTPNNQERRQTPRTPFHTGGYALLEGMRVEFQTHDVSLGGSLMELDRDLPLQPGMPLDVRLNAGFGARARVCWAGRGAAGKTMVGIKFEQLDFSEYNQAFSSL